MTATPPSAAAGLRLMMISSRNGWLAARGGYARPGSRGGARSQGHCASVAEFAAQSDWTNHVLDFAEHRVYGYADSQKHESV